MRRMQSAFVALCALTLILASGDRVRAAGLQLITPEEAALGAYQGTSIMTRGLGGPVIKIISPDQGNGDAVPVLGKPVHISVRFEPFADSQIDMSSLKVVYLVLFGVDITDRLKPYIAGNGIEAPEAEIPDGDHSIRVDIKDTSGHLSSQVFHFVVK
jgi:hypothetical protein